MWRPCRAYGCGRRVRGYGHWCDKHYHHRCRRGHEEQIPVTRTWLRPFQLRAVRFLDDHGEEAWIAMRKAWRQFVDNVRADLAAQERRGVCYRHERTAWREIVAVDGSVNEDELMTIAKNAYRYASGETKLVCRDISARAVQSLGTRLVEGYVGYGVHIAMELERRAKAADEIKDNALAAIRGQPQQEEQSMEVTT